MDHVSDKGESGMESLPFRLEDRLPEWWEVENMPVRGVEASDPKLLERRVFCERVRCEDCTMGSNSCPFATDRDCF